MCLSPTNSFELVKTSFTKTSHGERVLLSQSLGREKEERPEAGKQRQQESSVTSAAKSRGDKRQPRSLLQSSW